MDSQRLTLLSAVLVASATLGTACHVYVEEPRRRVVYTYTPPPPPPRRVAPTRPAYVAPPPSKELHLHAVSTQPGTSAAASRIVGTPSAGAASTAGATATSTTAAANCLDAAAAAVGDCGAMKAADPTCAPAGPVAAQMCKTFKTYFDPLVAAVAVSCMTSLTPKEVCDPSRVEGCARGALAQACPDATVSQLCEVAAGPCKTSPSDCSGLLAGLNDQGKEGVARCVAKGCGAGLFACVEGLSSSLSSSLH